MRPKRGWAWWLVVLVAAQTTSGLTHGLPLLLSLPIFVLVGLLVRLALRHRHRP
jgi:hypothetical protein